MLTALVYIVTAITFVAIDAIWLSNMSPLFYQPVLGDILLAKPNLMAALAFYLIFPIGLIVFAILPAINASSLFHAAFYGALFGLLAYATYDLTNYATLKNWSLALTVVDMIWGAVLSGLSSAITFTVVTKFASHLIPQAS